MREFDRLWTMTGISGDPPAAIGNGAPAAPGQPALPAPPAPMPEPPAIENGAPAPGGCDSSWGSREKIAEALGNLDERRRDAGRAINDTNENLAEFRKALLDEDEICESDLVENIVSAESRLVNLGIEGDLTAVAMIAVCIIDLRRRTDDAFDRATGSIRLRRLGAEMERLTAIVERAMNLEKALLRGVNKRDRVVGELGQFRREIGIACP